MRNEKGIKPLNAKRKGDQAIENKQVCEMVHFAAPMISRTYDQRRETARFARRKNPFAFAGFSASSRAKTQGSEINGGFGAPWRTSRGSATRKWRRRFQSPGGRIDQANSV
jgi:hypothetical protein